MFKHTILFAAVAVLALALVAGTANAALVHHYAFDETSGTTANDSAGSANATGGAGAWITGGQIGGAFDFSDGGNPFTAAGANVYDFAGGSMSASMWFRGGAEQR